MTPSYWNDAKKYLIKEDKVLAKIIKSFPNQSIEKRGSAYKTLLRAIVGQQISVKAADTIWSRFISLVGSPTPKKVSLFNITDFRLVGLSNKKATYILDLTEHFLSNEINPRKFSNSSDQELISQLIKVKGVGKWTAEMFLIFNLQRPDVLPIQDIGLIRAVERHYFLGENVHISKIVETAEAWKPWRSVATWYLWRSLDPIPVLY